MQLYVDRKESENSVVMIRWCLSPKEIKQVSSQIGSNDGSEPYALICVSAVENEGKDAKDYLEVNRLAVPLKNMATYISMNRSGRHRIQVFVVPNEKYAKTFLEIAYQKYSQVRYRETVYYRYTQVENDEFVDSSLRTRINTFIEVHVDERSFAKKPRDFNFINSWCEYLPFDQCSFRKRRWKVYPIVIAWSPIRTLLCAIFFPILLFLGYRGFNWKAINPFSEHRLFNLFETRSPFDSIFISDKDDKDIVLWRLLFFPPLWAGLALLYVIFGLTNLLIAFCCIAGALLAAGLAYWLVRYVVKYEQSPEHYKNSQRRADQKAEEKKRLEMLRQKALREELKELACEFVPEEIGLKTLPKDRQTVYLRFLDLKRKVCRPYSLD
ncbi:MAG: hypothetical protein WCT26_00945 [Candidatus Buchananbacteria bacterium]|jgi:hypothetical protein